MNDQSELTSMNVSAINVFLWIRDCVSLDAVTLNYTELAFDMFVFSSQEKAEKLDYSKVNFSKPTYRFYVGDRLIL